HTERPAGGYRPVTRPRRPRHAVERRVVVHPRRQADPADLRDEVDTGAAVLARERVEIDGLLPEREAALDEAEAVLGLVDGEPGRRGELWERVRRHARRPRHGREALQAGEAGGEAG